MLKNHLKVSVRNLLLQKGYTAINVFGLALGIASAMLIMLYIIDEVSFDKFHPNADNTYRICLDFQIDGNGMEVPFSCSPIGPKTVEMYPDILNFTRVHPFYGEPNIRYENNAFVEKEIFYADSTFFEVFTGFNLIKGDPNQVLNLPYQMVMTESTAKKYFGNENPIGKSVTMWQEKQSWEIVGIASDPPKNSHIDFDIVCSFVSIEAANSSSWVNTSLHTYLVLQENLDPLIVKQRFKELVNTYAGPQFEEYLDLTMEDFEKKGNRFTFYLQPLLNIHLKSTMPMEMKPGGSLVMIYVFTIIAIFILIIAAINFMNLSTVRSTKRAKEIGIRKVVGSSRSGLVGQFLTESVVITTFSLLIAIGIVIIATPTFNLIAGKSIVLSELPVGLTLGVLVATIIAIGFAAGSYPAFMLAGFEPLKVLKGRFTSGTKGNTLRRVLVIIQFTISVGLLVATFIIYQQVSFLENKQLGYSPEDVLIIKRSYTIKQSQREALNNELKKIPGVRAVSNSSALPIAVYGNTLIQKEGAAADDLRSFNFFYAHHDFDKVLQCEMVEGRYFSENFASDSLALIINETAAKELDFSGSVVGQVVSIDAQKRTIVGVVKDFHYESLHKNISPLAIVYAQAYSYLYIKLDNKNTLSTIDAIEDVWNKFSPNQALDYFFLNQAIKNLYEKEKQEKTLFTGFSILAIIIALLGLLGLSSYSTQQRTHEIGIRKVMGAKVINIIWLLLSEINRLFVLSTLIAWPLVWVFMEKWLEGFAFRITLSPLLFVAASLLAYVVVVITVSYQTIRAARTNPAITLTCE